MTNSFNILFHFRGHNRIALVDKTVYGQTTRYTVYFTDVELVLDFGGRIDYSDDGNYNFYKKHTAIDAEELHALIYPRLKAA